MNSGSKISHTNEKRNPKTGLREYYADAGRFGDDRIGIVDDEPAHINAWEEYLLDTHGEIGEEIVKTIGSGTINPETGMKEYGWKDLLPPSLGGTGAAYDPDWWVGENSMIGETIDEVATGYDYLENKSAGDIVLDFWEYVTPSGHTDWMSSEKNQEWHDRQDTATQMGNVMTSTIDTLGSSLTRGLGPGGSIAQSANLDRQLLSAKTSNAYTQMKDKSDQIKSHSGFATIGGDATGVKPFDFNQYQIGLEKSYVDESQERSDLVSNIQKELNQIVMGYQEATGNAYDSQNLTDLQNRLNELT